MRLVVVLGYSDGRCEGLHPICRARLERAAGISSEADAVVFSGWARRAGALAESELMRRAWTGACQRLICDDGSRITAENAAHVARLARELRASDVVLVTSWWHRLRAGLFFRALLRGSGARVSVASARSPWSPRLLLRELAVFLLVPLQLRRARRRLA